MNPLVLRGPNGDGGFWKHQLESCRIVIGEHELHAIIGTLTWSLEDGEVVCRIDGVEYARLIRGGVVRDAVIHFENEVWNRLGRWRKSLAETGMKVLQENGIIPC